MNPFSKYVDCINCGNELSDISSLTFNTPKQIICDYCGQRYPGLSRKIKVTKRITALLFVAVTILITGIAWKVSGVIPAIFSILPIIILYYFALGIAVRKSIRF